MNFTKENVLQAIKDAQLMNELDIFQEGANTVYKCIEKKDFAIEIEVDYYFRHSEFSTNPSDWWSEYKYMIIKYVSVYDDEDNDVPMDFMVSELEKCLI